MNETKLMASKYKECPACGTSLVRSFTPPRMKAVSAHRVNQDLPTVLGFEFECSLCQYKWFEQKESSQ